MVDGVAEAEAIARIDLRTFAQETCRRLWSCPLDGLLLLVRHGAHYAMRMFNTDGSEAEMCGNGIRCVARLLRERYLAEENFLLWSGGKPYPITHEKPIFEGLETFGVEIAIRLASDDFPQGEDSFLDQEIGELHPSLRFSYLNLGNPHLVARVEEVDYDLLTELGERIKSLPAWFPRGMNLSFVRVESPERLFVATYERGVGLTNSCGTAMTASTTAMALLGACEKGKIIDVCNRGGMVRCCCRSDAEGIFTRLVGNATYEQTGCLTWDGTTLSFNEKAFFAHERAAYNDFLDQI